MKHPLFFPFAAAVAAIPHLAHSQEKPTEPQHFHWGVSAGVNHYEEPHLMRLVGPELGLHGRLANFQAMPKVEFEGDVLLGKQRYTSEKSGSMNGVSNVETRWRALFALSGESPAQGFSAGLAVHTLWNDLRGNTSYQGKTYTGYQRIAAQLWLPLRWRSEQRWEIESGFLIYGRHASLLSEVNSNYEDIVNTQKNGQYAQVSMRIALANGHTIKPFVRYTHLGDSNQVKMGGQYWIEPESHRWQAGARWDF